MSAGARAACGAFALSVACVVVACLGPTEIVLTVRTDAPCTDPSMWQGVAVYAGQPGDDVESRAPAIVTTACDASGNVGSVVLVPTGSRSAEVGLRVVAGLTVDPESCAAQGYDGCIVARRTLSYLPHRSQQVVVDLALNCVGVGCNELQTCLAGTCTTTAAIVDAAPVDDGPTVRCGTGELRCPVDDAHACCVGFDVDAGTSAGSCIASGDDCPYGSAVLRCDKASDCASISAADPGVCCEDFTFGQPLAGTSCTPFSACLKPAGQSGLVMCNDREDCTTGEGGTALCYIDTGSPGYYSCEIP